MTTLVTTQYYPEGNLDTKIQNDFKKFLSSNPSIEEVINHPGLAVVINPCFSAFHPFVTGTTDENTITDKGALVYRDSKFAQESAIELASAVKITLSQYELKYGGDIFCESDLRKFGKVNRAKDFVYIKLNGGWTRVKGLTKKNYPL